MSVYTSVSREQLSLFLANYPIGELLCYEGIGAGISNSNYHLKTSAGAFVLTIFEHEKNRNLDYSLALQHHLGSQNIRCATPVLTNTNAYYSRLAGKPAAIINLVKGDVVRSPTPTHCGTIGAELARLHLAGANFNQIGKNPCGDNWRIAMQEHLTPHLDKADAKLLAEEIAAYQIFEGLELPQGAVHADLFHDNALFEGTELSGMIDFEYACDDFWIYDIAIAVNDWCIFDNGQFDQPRLDAFIAGYQSIRGLSGLETKMLPLMLRLAACRFWLSRLHDKVYPMSGELTFSKDPNEFRDMIILRRDVSVFI